MPPRGTWDWFLVTLLIRFFCFTRAPTAYGQVITVVTTSTATAFSDCTCTQLSRSDPSTTSNDLSTSSQSSTNTILPLEVSTVISGKSTNPTSVGTSSKEIKLLSSQFTLSICPTRIVNPTYTPPSPLPTDYTWGCPPRHLCQPNKKTKDGECNFEAGPPADTYYCSPEQCISSPPLLPSQFWGQPILSDQVGQFRVSPGYFNLNPHEFGLDYSIFLLAGPITGLKRELSVRIPGKCYDECNDAMLEAESSGKTNDLCDTDSAFLKLVRSCQSCVASVDLSRTSATALPEFQQFLYFCEETYNANSSALISTTSTTIPSLKWASTVTHSYSSNASALNAAPSTIVSHTWVPTMTASISLALASTATRTSKATTTIALYATDLVQYSIASPLPSVDSSTGPRSVALFTERFTGAVVSTKTECPSRSSTISGPLFTSGGSLLPTRWGSSLFPFLLALLLWN